MRHMVLAVYLFITFAAFANAQDNNQPPEGFTSLYNGQDLSGWFGLGHFSPVKLSKMTDEERTALREKNATDVAAHWQARKGSIYNDGKGVYLTTDQEYGDVEFWVDYKMAPKGDSGVYLRTTPQVQIWDYTEEGGKWNIGADKGSGGLWNNSKDAPGKDPLVFADKDFGEWNRFRIQQVGGRTSVWLNEKQVVKHETMENFWDRSRPLRRKGHIQLQTHGGEIEWRNVFVKELTADESNAILAAHGEDGFESIFNGKDFDGWAGPTDNYEIEEGVLRCKPGKGGTIFTKQEYNDFAVRLEFKLPPGGNNGLAIRYPGKGDTAYHGMCELQVLDTEHPKYKSLDPRQAHGSAYGMAAATRGYLRDAGEWNFQEVTVSGSKIKVELNGSVILDTDLSTITEYMSNTPHPGKDRKSGHFGFAGHNDAVEYRNVRLRVLKSEGTVAKVIDAKLGSTVNVHRVGNIYLAGQPGKKDLPLLKEAGIKHVLDLRAASEIDWDEAAESGKAGLEHCRLAISGPKGMTNEVFDKARKMFAAANESEKVICHCGGANRVGAVWLTYRVLDEGIDWETALQEAKDVGLKTPGFVEAAQRYVDSHSK